MTVRRQVDEVRGRIPVGKYPLSPDREQVVLHLQLCTFSCSNSRVGVIIHTNDRSVLSAGASLVRITPTKGYSHWKKTNCSSCCRGASRVNPVLLCRTPSVRASAIIPKYVAHLKEWAVQINEYKPLKTKSRRSPEAVFQLKSVVKVLTRLFRKHQRKIKPCMQFKF